jgi:hypothetical protein
MPSIISATTTSGLVNTADNSGNLQFQTQNGANTITLPNSSGTLATTANLSGLGFKNRVINGAMVIDQRNAGASVTPTSGNYTLDRWQCFQSSASKYSVQQNAGSVTPPVGFTNYLGATSLAATSLSANSYYIIEHKIEGYNTADLDWGTANAKTVTLSFWVRSSLTGTFGAAILNYNNTRSYPFSYAISAANTWEQKSVTIAGDTSGDWNKTNNVGLYINFGLGVGTDFSGTAGSWSGNQYWATTGAVSVVGTNGATWYVTGVQLEVGSTATSFDYRPYGTELALCQRYAINYRSVDGGTFMRYGSGFATGTTTLEINVPFPVQMRTNPSLSVTATASDYAIYVAGGVNPCNSLPTLLVGFSRNPLVTTVVATSSASFSNSSGGGILSNSNTTSYMLFTAEL